MRIYAKGKGPYQPDVEALRKAFPPSSLHEGRVLTHDEVSNVIGEPSDTDSRNRGYRIFKSFRTAMQKEHKIIIQATGDGTGYKVISDTAKVDLQLSQANSAIRMANRSTKTGSCVDVRNLSKDDRDRHLFGLRRTAAIIGIGRIRRMTELPKLNDDDENEEN